ncbi:MAG: metal ABC transporter ATP-binding protein [Muribaculaceae bacterium]|nr:metal ABC transporter ATP-binding protein [Muribaculaceae bacterium]
MKADDKDILRLSDVGMDFDGKWPLRNVNLSLRRGSFVILSGPNGSGKTTLLRIMLRLLKPTTGKVEYFGADGRPIKKLKIGYLPQKNNIDTHFPISVKDTILSGLRTGWLCRLPEDWTSRIDEVVRECGVREYLERPIGTLSGGQLQRTLLARAIIGKPELLVLDEPLSYIDKQFEQFFYALIKRLSQNMTVLLVSHELSGLAPLADRTICLNDLKGSFT